MPRSEHGVTKAGRDLQDPPVQASAQQGHDHPKSTSPWPHLEPSWTLQRWWLHPLPGWLSSWSSENILGWEGPTRIIESISREWHNQGSKPQPWLCQHHLSSSQGLSIPLGGIWKGSTVIAAPALCVTLCHCPGSCSASSVGPPVLLLTLYLCTNWCQSAAFWVSWIVLHYFLAVSPLFRVFLREPAHTGRLMHCPGQVCQCQLNCFCSQLSTREQHLHENTNWRRFPYSESLVLNQGNILLLRERLCLIKKLMLVAPLCQWGAFPENFGTGCTSKVVECFLCSSPVSITTVSHALTMHYDIPAVKSRNRTQFI